MRQRSLSEQCFPTTIPHFTLWEGHLGSPSTWAFFWHLVGGSQSHSMSCSRESAEVCSCRVPRMPSSKYRGHLVMGSCLACSHVAVHVLVSGPTLSHSYIDGPSSLWCTSLCLLTGIILRGIMLATEIEELLKYLLLQF